MTSGGAMGAGSFAEIDDGVRIYYEVHGEGEPMVLIHGYPLNSGLVRDNLGPLSELYQIITADLRDYGCGETPDSEWSTKIYASDVLAVMNQAGVAQAIIGGMSMDGPIVFEIGSPSVFAARS